MIAEIRALPGVKDAMLVERTGLPQQYINPELSAMTASLWGLGEYYTGKFGDKLKSIEINGSKTVILAFLYEEDILLVIAEDEKVKDRLKEIIETSEGMK